ncbi:hypothetical protein ACTA71_010545 [Dictyostelium dimigraforme]
MKVILSLIIFTLSIVSVLSTSYVNFIPYKKGSNCKGGNDNIKGVGYSVPTDSCITFDYFRNWKFSLSSDSTVKFSAFSNGTSSDLDCSEPFGETVVVSNGQCIESLGEHYFDGYFVPQRSNSYLVTISTTPSYSEFSWVNSFSYGKGCHNDDIVFASFATNFTAIQSEDQETVFCRNKEPLYNYCSTYNGLPYCSTEYFYYVCLTEEPFISSEEEGSPENPMGFYKTTTCMGDL